MGFSSRRNSHYVGNPLSDSKKQTILKRKVIREFEIVKKQILSTKVTIKQLEGLKDQDIIDVKEAINDLYSEFLSLELNLLDNRINCYKALQRITSLKFNYGYIRECMEDIKKEIEKKEQLIEIPVKLIIISVCAFLYSYAGMNGTPLQLRRFLAPAICVSTMFYFIRDWRVFLQLPFMFASLSIGYGGDETLVKILKRALYGFSNGVSFSMYNIYSAIKESDNKKYLIASFYTLLLISSYIVFGVWNPLGSARIEETLLGYFVFGIPILTARRK